jgi:hypothetical protein
MTVTTLKSNSLAKDTRQAKHKWLRLLKATLLLSIFTIKEVVFVHKFFFYTFFRSSISDVSPPVKLNIGYGNKLQFKLIMLIRYLIKNQFWGQKWYKRVHNSILKNLQQQDLDRGQLKMAIDTIKPGEISAQEFVKKYVKAGIPVIIKGGAKHTYAYQNWTPQMFGDRFGDLQVNLLDRNTNELFAGTVKEIIDSKGTTRQLYLQNCSDIFSSYPELSEELGYAKFREYIGGKSTRFGGAQLLLGVHPSTGTDAHCGNNTNLFFQIYGNKKWTFVHPDYLWLMYPMLNSFFTFCGSFLKKDYDEAYLNKYAPLQQYCPKYEAVLEPGDILLNPPWVWHDVNNLTDDTIAVATRWFPRRGLSSTNVFFDMMQLFSPTIWRLRFEALKKNPDEPFIMDEQARGLVKSYAEYLEFGKKKTDKNWEFLDRMPNEYQF